VQNVVGHICHCANDLKHDDWLKRRVPRWLTLQVSTIIEKPLLDKTKEKIEETVLLHIHISIIQ
jgi:hypothetical protein